MAENKLDMSTGIGPVTGAPALAPDMTGTAVTTEGGINFGRDLWNTAGLDHYWNGLQNINKLGPEILEDILKLKIEEAKMKFAKKAKGVDDDRTDAEADVLMNGTQPEPYMDDIIANITGLSNEAWAGAVSLYWPGIPYPSSSPTETNQ